ncbi:hypothetical protein CVT25_005539 [Psilocybe cyanescens]|uniref:Uncharacterized protein n=1 Tax=Psilocybe cyanescens TaxID=93625 RepID=A0A409VQR7_PSICY|nr:hypothetical protein CVT25_005539 [Psilocybe cyanescens]
MSYFDSDSECESYYGPPVVTRGAFTFKEGMIYAEFEGPCHPRTDAAELHRLLTYSPPPPVLTKAGTVAKRQPKDTHVDPDAHYYSAQLIHYGLKPLKTKIPAKKRLLAAFGDGKTLQVPKAIIDLEAIMKKEWQTLDSKYKEEQEVQRKIQSKRDEEARLEMIKWEEARLLEKPGPSLITTMGTTKMTAKGNAKPPTNSIQARVDTVLAKRPKPATQAPKMTSAERQKAVNSLSVDQARGLLAVLLEKIPAAEKILDAELFSIKAKSPKIKEKLVDSSVWTGVYDVEAPMIVEDQELRGSVPSTLEIYPSSTSAHLWASFELGVLKGVMRSLHPVPKFLNTEVYFEYRGYEAGEDCMTFSDDNRAILIFLPGGLFEGKINTECFGTFKIYGALKVQGAGGNPIGRKSVTQQKEAVSSWKADFRSINYHNYEIAGTERWGGWGGDTDDDKAFESDTTDGKQKRKKVGNLHKFMKRTKDDLNGKDDSDSDSDKDIEDLDSFGYECEAF